MPKKKEHIAAGVYVTCSTKACKLLSGHYLISNSRQFLFYSRKQIVTRKIEQGELFDFRYRKIASFTFVTADFKFAFGQK